jgi:hypothetical protein
MKANTISKVRGSTTNDLMVRAERDGLAVALLVTQMVNCHQPRLSSLSSSIMISNDRILADATSASLLIEIPHLLIEIPHLLRD